MRKNDLDREGTGPVTVAALKKPFVEPFDPTVQELRLDVHLDLVFTNLDLGNPELAHFLIVSTTQLPHRFGKLEMPTHAFADATQLCHKDRDEYRAFDSHRQVA